MAPVEIIRLDGGSYDHRRHFSPSPFYGMGPAPGRICRGGKTSATQIETETHMRLNMRTNLNALLSAVGVTVLLAAPAMAKTVRHQHAAPSTVYIPSDARRSVAPHGGAEGGPYTPSGATQL